MDIFFASLLLGIVGQPPTPCAWPAILVHVTGLKDRAGTLRLRTFGGKYTTYFDKNRALHRLVTAIPPTGPIEICMPVPGQGRYAIDVRHDSNGDGKTDISDGAGISGNPDGTLFDFLFRIRPPAHKVQIVVGNEVVRTSIVVKYLSGGRFEAVSQPAS